jgi:putative ABC transport system permease protein
MKALNRFLSSLALGFMSALREIRSQPLRSILSMAGVALAVGAVAALLSIVAGLKTMVRETVADMGGAGRVMVQQQSPTDPLEGRKYSRSPGLVPSDGDSIARRLAGDVSVLRTDGQNATVDYQGVSTRIYLMGCDRDYLTRDVQAIIPQGRMPDADEFSRGDAVALVGWTLAEQWGALAKARGGEIVGSRLSIGGVSFEVVGTFQFKRNNWGRNGRTVAIPYQAWTRFYQGGAAQIGAVQVRIEDPEKVEEGLAKLRTVLLGLHRGAEDFLFQQFDFLANMTTMISNISLLFGVVAALSLAVGALGIFNTMLAGLNDRIREIGVRKALGARPFQIAVQFLAESVVLCLIGGLGGLALGSLPSLFGDWLQKAVSVRPEFTLMPVLGAMGLAIAIGVVAGLWPAIRAAKLDAVDALRYE